jgi:hypothetical protein
VYQAPKHGRKIKTFAKTKNFLLNMFAKTKIFHKRFRENSNFLRKLSWKQKFFSKTKFFRENFGKSRNFCKNKNFGEHKYRKILQKVSKFLLIFTFCENQTKGIFVSTLRSGDQSSGLSVQSIYVIGYGAESTYVL